MTSHIQMYFFRCPQDTNVQYLHRREMEKAAREAREKYEADHPEAAGSDLKYDPAKILEDSEYEFCKMGKSVC